MRLLIGGSPTKLFHLKEFKESLKKFNVETKLVIDTDILDGFPSRNLKKWFQNKNKFNNLINDFKPDVIFVDRQTTLFQKAAIETGIPVLSHLRGHHWLEIKWAKETEYKYPIKRIILKIREIRAEKCYRDSKAILPICNYLKKVVTNHFPEKKNKVLYQGIDPKKWYPVKGMTLKHPCVGLLQGAVIWGKAQEMFILQKVLESMPNVMFYWVGDGPYREKILEKLSKYDNFEWLGHLQYPDKVREYLTEIDVYALVSGIDMSPLTLLEAQLMEKPVIASNVGGVSEIMRNNETGFLVKKGDSDEWIEKLSKMINNLSESKKMGKAGRKFVEENFQWDKIAKDFLDILEDLEIIKK